MNTSSRRHFSDMPKGRNPFGDVEAEFSGTPTERAPVLQELPCTCGAKDEGVGPHHGALCAQWARRPREPEALTAAPQALTAAPEAVTDPPEALTKPLDAMESAHNEHDGGPRKRALIGSFSGLPGARRPYAVHQPAIVDDEWCAGHRYA